MSISWRHRRHVKTSNVRFLPCHISLKRLLHLARAISNLGYCFVTVFLQALSLNTIDDVQSASRTDFLVLRINVDTAEGHEILVNIAVSRVSHDGGAMIKARRRDCALSL